MEEEVEEGPFTWAHKAFAMPVKMQAPADIFDAIEVRDAMATSWRIACASALGLCWHGLRALPKLSQHKGNVYSHGKAVHAHLMALGISDAEIVAQGLRAFRLVCSVIPTEQGVKDALHPTEAAEPRPDSDGSSSP